MDNKIHALLIPALLGGLTAVIHLLTAADTYGIFRDELYYVANGRHLGFGYVEHPPLIGWISWLAVSLFGTSQLALRFFPALASGLTVFFTGWTTREMGGGRFAQVLAGVAAALAPVYVSIFGILSMNAFDIMFWSMAILIITMILRTGDLRLWLLFGLVAGLGLETKISMLFLGFGIVVGLVLTRDWKHFQSRWLWLGGALAFLLFLPYLIWQVTHDWAMLEFMSRATQFKNLPLSPFQFLASQLLMMNPAAAPIALAALWFYFISARGKSCRAFGWACVAIFVVMVLQRAKPYYFAPTFVMLFAGGSVALEAAAARRGLQWLRPVYPALIGLSGLVLLPMGKPILPVETFVKYQAALGMGPTTDERHELGRLPQFFADRLGWRDLAETVASVYNELSPAEQDQACIFGQNYGQAGAIDLFGPDLGLPGAISGHNTYWWWGHGDCSGKAVIIIGGDLKDHQSVFETVELATTFTCGDCMPYENNKPIWVGRDAQVAVDDIWPQMRHYN